MLLRKNILGLLSFLVVVALLLLYILDRNGIKRIAYVDNVKLFNEFALKKELESELKKKESAWKATLDSVRVQLDMLSLQYGKQVLKNPSTEEQMIYWKQYYMKLEEDFSKESETLSAGYDAQIWNQLNSYVKEFAEAEGIELLIGTSGDGTLMYGKENMDITGNVLAFVNTRYSGMK